MKRIFVFIMTAMFLTASVSVNAQGIDAGRAAAWTLYSNQSKKAIKAQEAAQMLMATGHIWLKEEEDVLRDFHKQFNEYLDDFHDVLSIAAEVYGLYYEVSNVAGNVKNLSNVVAESPTNTLAVAFSTRRNVVYRNIVKTGIDLVMDIRKLCFEGAKLTEKERTLMLKHIRPKIKYMNKQLRQLTLAIKYTSFMDVWNEIRDRAYNFQPRTKKEIADECMREWRNLGRLGH